MDKPSFEQLIREDRAARESKRWRGTFLEYLERVRQNPLLTKLSHARLYDMIMRDGHPGHPRVGRPAREAALQGRVAQGLQLLPRRVLRHREDDRADRALLPLRLAEGRGEPPGALPDGPGRLRQELAGREAAARPRASPIPSTRSTAARCTRSRCTSCRAICARSSRRCSASHIEGDLCPVCRFRLKEEFGSALRGGAGRHARRSRSATASASASCRRSIRTTRTPRC